MPQAQASAVLLGGLDPHQRAAVTARAGPLLVAAGAGSGKTLVLTRRIAHLIAADGLRPEQVLAIAFTNRAARELKTRVAALVGEAAARRAAVATFHSACHRFLVRPHAERLGRSAAFSIYDGHDAHRLLAEAVSTGSLGAVEAQRLISAEKARLGAPDSLGRGERGDAERQALVAVWRRYEDALERADALDLDDLIAGAVRLLAGHADLRERTRRRWRLVLVDEYQDVNPAQVRFVELLVGERPNLTAAGDEDQLVFGFRHAEPGHMLRFERRFPGARVVTLERNYRSSRRIVEAAGRLIEHNSQRRPKRVYSEEAEGRPVAVLAYDNEHAEAHAAGRWCALLIERRVPAHEIAVLFRTRRQARPLERALLVARVPYCVLGAQGFWEHAEVRDAVAYLSLLANPRDRLAFERALGSPPRGLGPAAVRRLESFAQARSIDLLSALVRAGEVPGLHARQTEAASALGLALAKLVLERRSRGLAGTVAETLLASGLPRALRRAGGSRADERVERLRDVVRAARAYEAAGEPGGLVGFLAHASLASADGEEEQSRVSLATIHAAKGLEWCHVRVVGLEEGLLPHGRCQDEAELEEERRLVYVAMTRAREELVLSWAGSRRGVPGRRPSRFALEAGLQRPPDRGARGPLSRVHRWVVHHETKGGACRPTRSPLGRTQRRPGPGPGTPRRRLPATARCRRRSVCERRSRSRGRRFGSRRPRPPVAAEPGFDPEQILKALNAHGVAYVVVGGFAVAAHGVVRATADLDLVVERSWENAARLGSALTELAAVDASGASTPLTQEVLVRRADRRFRTSHGDVHVLNEVGGVPDYRALVPPDWIRLGDETVAIATLASVRAMKRAAGRLKDHADLEELEALHGADDRSDT